MSFESKLKELNIVLPNAAAPVGSYVAAKIIGKLLYISCKYYYVNSFLYLIFYK